MDLNINLNELIPPNFRKAAIDILNCNVNMAVFKGGRGSFKSTTADTIIPLGCMIYKCSAVCVSKRQNLLRSRLVEKIVEAIDRMGLSRYWKWRRSPDELVLLDEYGKETNHSIKFIGMDDPKNKKSFGARDGSFRYCFIEECSDFSSIDEIQMIEQTMLRGNTGCLILAYNPPLFSSNWVNKAFNKPVGRALGYDSDYYYYDFEYEVLNEKRTRSILVHHSTLYDIVKTPLRRHIENLVGQAEQSKIENERYYKWAYLGSVEGGDDARVFWNIHDWDGDVTGLKLNTLNRGLDHSNGGQDPTTGVVWYFDRRNNRLYAIDEFYGSKMSIEQTAQAIKLINRHNFPVYADSAVPILNTQLNTRGLNIIGAKKPPGSVEAGIKWLQSLNGIYICRQKTPNIYREFNGYEWEITKDEVITHNLPDKDNHTIDATRYAFSIEIKYD